MTAARSRRAGRGRKVTQEIKRGTTRTGAAKAREFASMSPDREPKPKAAQTGTSRKAMRDAPKPEREIKRGTTRVRKTADGSKKTKPTLNKQGAAAFAKALDEAGKRKAAKKAEAEAKAKAEAKAEAEKKKDKEKKTLFGIEIKPSSRFAGRGGKARRVAGRAMGGMMKSKMASKGGAKGGKRMPPGMKKGGSASKFPDMTGDGKVTQKDILRARGVPGFSKGDVVVNMVRELSKLGRRAFEKEYGKAALNKAIKETNKASGLTPTKAKKTPTQKKLAEADQRAEQTKFTRQTPAAKKQRQVQVNEKRMERMKNGGMMKSKMSSKGGAKGGRRPGGMQAGGMMKSKMSSKGGAKGGRMPGGMKNGGMAKKTKKGYALGGMAKKGMAKGGAMTKKGMAKGGTNKKRAVSRKPRGVGAALRGFGKAMKK